VYIIKYLHQFVHSAGEDNQTSKNRKDNQQDNLVHLISNTKNGGKKKQEDNRLVLFQTRTDSALDLLLM